MVHLILIKCTNWDIYITYCFVYALIFLRMEHWKFFIGALNQPRGLVRDHKMHQLNFILFFDLFQNISTVCFESSTSIKNIRCSLWIYRVHRCVLQCSTLESIINVDSWCAYDNTVYYTMQHAFFKLYALKILYWCFIASIMPQGHSDNEANGWVQTCVL